MSLGGFVPFLNTNVVEKRRLPILIALTLLGSTIGAVLLSAITFFYLLRTDVGKD